MGSKDLIKILEANGFHLVKGRGAGSHRVFKSPSTGAAPEKRLAAWNSMANLESGRN